MGLQKASNYPKCVLFNAAIILLATGMPQLSSAQAARFSGGACVSQGDWVQGALEKSQALVAALETLRDDPNCTALTNTLNNSEELKELSSNMGANVETQGMAGVFSELQAIGTYLNADKSGASSANFREIVNYMVFRKSLDTIKDVQINTSYTSLPEDQKSSVDMVSQKLRSFLERSGNVAKIASTTTTRILSALPQHMTCFNGRPEAAGTIFASLVGATSALATGGQISNAGEMIGTLVNFDRQMRFARILSGVELERYRASMSCLVESTQEAYCSLQDAQQALDFNRGSSDGQVPKNAALDFKKGVVETPMMGLTVLLRDIPTITNWMQRILFGIDPQLMVEADMKNANWQSLISFQQSINSLLGTYREKKATYIDATRGQSIQNKAANLKQIVEVLSNQLRGGSFKDAKEINFFTSAMADEAIPFYLIGVDMPANYNQSTMNFTTLWFSWLGERSNGLADPDALIETVGMQLDKLREAADVQFSRYFSSRMIVDSQNLIVEGMNGPNISPYKALLNVKLYLADLKVKLLAGLEVPHIRDNKANADAYRAMTPLIDDTILRIERITNAMAAITSSNNDNQDLKTTEADSRKTMDVIYELANMRLSRNSFLETRVNNAVRMDISDTLWRKTKLNNEQEQLMLSMGKDIITNLSLYFTRDPILQRLDVAQAEPIHNQNIVGAEELFVRNYFDLILDLNCKIYGESACGTKKSIAYPDQKLVGWQRPLNTWKYMFTMKYVQDIYNNLTAKPTEDSSGIYNHKARLCLQTLGFPKYYKNFIPHCKGAQIISEFSDANNSEKLNISYDEVLADIEKINSEKKPGHITKARTTGVCAVRSYIRKNTVYRMYKELQAHQ